MQCVVEYCQKFGVAFNRGRGSEVELNGSDSGFPPGALGREAPPFQSIDCRFDPPYDQPKVVEKCVTRKSQLYHPGTPYH